MRAGGLKTPIVIESDVGTAVDSVGSRIEDWQPVHSCRARFAHRNGRQFIAAMQQNAELSALLIVRADARLDPIAMHSMRVRIGDRKLDIMYAVDPDESGKEIHIYTKEAQL